MRARRVVREEGEGVEKAETGSIGAITAARYVSRQVRAI